MTKHEEKNELDWVYKTKSFSGKINKMYSIM